MDDKIYVGINMIICDYLCFDFNLMIGCVFDIYEQVHIKQSKVKPCNISNRNVAKTRKGGEQAQVENNIAPRIFICNA